LPDGSGLDVLTQIKEEHPDAIVIMITGNVLVGNTIAALRGGAGRIAIGLPAGAAAARLGSGSGLNCARQGGESCDFFATMQAVTRSTFGISELHSRKASLVQACSCSGV